LLCRVLRLVSIWGSSFLRIKKHRKLVKRESGATTF
jgi:hypothetical protein